MTRLLTPALKLLVTLLPLVYLSQISAQTTPTAAPAKAEGAGAEVQARYAIGKELRENLEICLNGAKALSGSPSTSSSTGGKSAYQTEIERCQKIYDEGMINFVKTTPAEDTCTKAATEFNTAQSTFLDACGKAGLRPDKEGKGFGCSTAVNACNFGCDTGLLEDDEELEALCDADNDSKLSPRLATLQKEYKTCSPKATEDLEGAEEKFESKKDRVESDQDKLREEEAALAELQLNSQAVMAKLDEKAMEIEEALKEATSRAEAVFKEKSGALAEAIIKLENAKLQAEGGIREVEIKEQNAVVEKNKMIMDLKQTCLASALKALDDRRKLRAQQRATATYTAGTLKNLWGQVGTSLLQKDQNYVDDISKTCEQGKAVQNNIKMINEMHEARKLGFIEEKRRHLVNIQRADREITNLQQGQKSEALSAYQKAVSDARDFAMKQWNLLKQERARAMMALQNQMAQKQKEIQVLQARLQTMSGEFEEARQIYTLAKKYGKSGRKSKSGDTYDTAMTGLQNARDKAATVNECCTNPDSDFSKKPGNSSICARAKSALGESTASEADGVSVGPATRGGIKD